MSAVVANAVLDASASTDPLSAADLCAAGIRALRDTAAEARSANFRHRAADRILELAEAADRSRALAAVGRCMAQLTREHADDRASLTVGLIEADW